MPGQTLRSSRVGLCLLAFSLSFVIFAPRLHAANPEVDELFRLINQRLVLMKDVAAFKYANNIAVENRQREVRVLRQVKLAAEQEQLEPQFVTSFFKLQINLAKVVQRGWMEGWQTQTADDRPGGSVRDIVQIRSDLIALGGRIITQIPRALPALHDDEEFESNLLLVEQLIDNPFVTRAQKHQLLHALIRVNPKAPAPGNRLARVLEKGVLRVGTTGDYKPFSYIEPGTGHFTGIDIDLAADLAASLGVELRLVPTSWPTLMADLQADRFDIGISGITRTLQRQRTAFFSDHYSVGGKTPIARCEAADNLNSLKTIDRPGVRVIVNPGGTNEKYVRKHIKNAQIILYPDNTTIFEQIINKDADVMITDAIEVKVQAGLHPELCATMPGYLLTRAEKGFLLPQDVHWQEYVNAWLREVKQSDHLGQYFARYIK